MTVPLSRLQHQLEAMLTAGIELGGLGVEVLGVQAVLGPVRTGLGQGLVQILLVLEGPDRAGAQFGQPVGAFQGLKHQLASCSVAIEFAKTNEKFVILGGAMGTTVLNPDAVKALASLPSLDELRAKIIAILQTPATRIAGVLQAPAGQLARVFNAYATKDAA